MTYGDNTSFREARNYCLRLPSVPNFNSFFTKSPSFMVIEMWTPGSCNKPKPLRGSPSTTTRTASAPTATARRSPVPIKVCAIVRVVDRDARQGCAAGRHYLDIFGTIADFIAGGAPYFGHHVANPPKRRRKVTTGTSASNKEAFLKWIAVMRRLSRHAGMPAPRCSRWS